MVTDEKTLTPAQLLRNDAKEQREKADSWRQVMHVLGEDEPTARKHFDKHTRAALALEEQAARMASVCEWEWAGEIVGQPVALTAGCFPDREHYWWEHSDTPPKHCPECTRPVVVLGEKEDMERKMSSGKYADPNALSKEGNVFGWARYALEGLFPLLPVGQHWRFHRLEAAIDEMESRCRATTTTEGATAQEGENDAD